LTVWSGWVRDEPMVGNKKPPPAQLLHEGCALVLDHLKC
jgi:hypothetical protein